VRNFFTTALLATLICTTLAGCYNQDPTPQTEATGRLQIIATALPSYNNLAYQAEISFTGKPSKTFSWEGSRTSPEFELAPGMWNIALTALDNNEIVANGNKKFAEVSAGRTERVTVELKLLSEGEAKGRLKINAGALAGYDNLAYEAQISRSGESHETFSWEGSRASPEFELPSGMWDIALTALGGDKTIAAGTKESVQVAAGETTEVSISLEPVSEGANPAVEEGILSVTVTGSFPGGTYALTLSRGGEALDKNLDENGSGRFTLTSGLWDIALSVKQNGDTIANASATGVLVKKDEETSVTLEPVMISGTGIFSWTVNYPGGVSAAKITKAEMRIRDSKGAAAPGFDPFVLSTSGAPNGTVTLDSGSWTAEFSVEMQWGSSVRRSTAKRGYVIEIVKDQTLNRTYAFDYRDFVLLLEAAADSGSAYPVIQSKGFDYESPDQTNGGHESFGPHIVQRNDAALGKNVFAFIMHRDIDRNATGDWTRQRVEVKVNHSSSSGGRDYCALGEDEGRSFIYRWKFKLPADFAVSTDFTHIHQIKNEGGDATQPVIALTARNVGGSNRMQLSYYAPGSSSPTQWVNDNSHLLAPYLGQWVQCEESVTYSSSAVQASYSLKITRIDNKQELMSYTAGANTIQTWRNGNTHGRPKFGLYRRIFTGSSPGNNTEPSSANAIAGLKDETILYADFEIIRLK
jgi:hypothetical protein